MNRIPLILSTVILIATVNSASAEDGIIGTWRSAELNTGSTLQLHIGEDLGSIVMDFWSTNGGKISPHPQRHVSDIPIASANTLCVGDRPLKTVVVFNFKEVIYEVFKTESGIRLEAEHHYTDNSGRTPLVETLNFVRGTYEEAATKRLGNDTSEKGWLGTWKNRDEGTRGIAQLLIQDLNPVMMSTWGIMGGKISSKRSSYVELPLASEEAASLRGKTKLKATYDYGWAFETYTMELHEDGITLTSHMDYHDARGERSYEYEFVRGAWKDR
ncbi:MAG: hypothetical protein AAF357_04595 [Verrucomicrobiota bacterium]